MVWASCPVKGLAGAAKAAPARVLAEETYFVHLIFVALALVVALFVLCLRLLSGFPFMPCYAWPWRVALTAHAQVKGSKAEPLLLYTDRIPRAWATHKRSTLLGKAQNGARAVGADVYRGQCSARRTSPRPALNARHGGSCVTWGSCVGRFPDTCITLW